MTKKKPSTKARVASMKIKEQVLKRKKLLIVVGIFFLLAVVGYYTLGLQIKFILQEEMDLVLIPAEASYTVPYTKFAQVNFSLDVNRPAICDFTCDHQFIDLSTGSIIDQKTTTNEQVISSYDLSVDVVGEGQHIYSYQVVCHNIDSNFCSTSEKKYFKSALVTVNYELPLAEKNAKLAVQEDAQTILDVAAILKVKMLHAKDLAASLNIPSPVNSSLLELATIVESVQSRWDGQTYSSLVRLLGQDIFAHIAELNTTTSEIITGLENLKNQTEVSSLFLEDVTNASKMQEFANLFVNSSFESQYATFVSQVNATVELYTNFTFSTRADYEVFIATVNNLILDYGFVTAEFAIQKQAQQDAVFSAVTTQKNIYSSLGISRQINMSTVTCATLVEENLFIQLRNANVTLNRLNFDSTIPVAFFANLSNEFITTLGTGVNWGSYDGTLVNGTPYLYSAMPISSISELINLPELQVSSCMYSAPASNITSFVAEVFQPVLDEQVVNTTLQEHKPICCFEGDCQVCCTGESCSEVYPVVFVHGHALSESNSPEESYSSFGKIQHLLEEEGYISAGQLGTDSAFAIPAGDWGRTAQPISIRLSYYVISYFDVGSYKLATQKTDKIENYAIRLKDLIETIKYRTGKDKVDIVAHSMGGLVTREYIALFGEESVHKFIMIGTPNFGITGRTSKYCSLTGASRECTDMEENSIFLKRLNVPQNAFKEIAGYTIRASGCDMGDGNDGDGVVLIDHVPLNYTTNFLIEGECTDLLKSDLHTRMLDPDEYMQTYELIRAILVN